MLADFDKPEHRHIVLVLTSDYFAWMNGEIQQAMGCSIPELVGMELEPYIDSVMVSVCRSTPPESVFYFATIHGRSVGMGGLRRLPDGSAEVVRIYTRPEYRGCGIGTMVLQQLISEARRFGYAMLKLDTGVFMKAAQSIYKAAGFVEIEPYQGAEPPATVHAIWLFMQKTL
ncbi:GNAT family N-acetyltransferase [Cyanobium sp. Alchichica 3B3-8F6]|nr:GNAT family N-acetyltransferase [Cyanobium sp. Alchichica 3B3-8F6]MCP9882442.1 GNAT family N-acetyltransferase [Cyanobium sp. Alchichica 3B3-8F6]